MNAPGARYPDVLVPLVPRNVAPPVDRWPPRSRPRPSRWMTARGEPGRGHDHAFADRGDGFWFSTRRRRRPGLTRHMRLIEASTLRASGQLHRRDLRGRCLVFSFAAREKISRSIRISDLLACLIAPSTISTFALRLLSMTFEPAPSISSLPRGATVRGRCLARLKLTIDGCGAREWCCRLRQGGLPSPYESGGYANDIGAISPFRPTRFDCTRGMATLSPLTATGPPLLPMTA